MQNFKTETIVDGDLVVGRIKGNKFYMSSISNTKTLEVSARIRPFTKEQLETVISELEKIKDKL